MSRFVIEAPECHLLKIVGAMRAARCLTGRLHRRRQQSDKYANDGNYDQQLNERKAASGSI